MATITRSTARGLLQHWGANITYFHNSGINYPGFSYTEEEKHQLAELGRGVGLGKELAFRIVFALYVLVIAGLAMGVFMPLAFVLDPAHQSALIFMACLGTGVAVSIGMGIPVGMGLAVTTMHKFGADPEPTDVPDEVVAILFAKLHQQFRRVALIVGVLIGPWILFGMTRAGAAFLHILELMVALSIPFLVLYIALLAIRPATKKY